MRRTEDAEAAARTEAAVRAFGAPHVLVATGTAAAPTSLVSFAVSRGCLAFAVELGCRGAVSADALAIARRGVRNVLAHFGLTAGQPDCPYAGPLWRIPDTTRYLYAPCGGVFEPLSALGAQVEAGAPAGRIHDLDDPGAEPRTVCFARAGVQFCRRGPAWVERGNCLAVVAVPDAD